MLHPSVLLTVSATPPSTSEEQPSLPLSANGFILGKHGNGDTLVVTTTTWLKKILNIKLSVDRRGHYGVSWKFCGDSFAHDPKFTVLVQTLGDSVSEEIAM